MTSPETGPASPQVLVVEDDPAFGPLVIRALDRAGLRSQLGVSGDDALRSLGAHPELSVVVLDVMIPHPDGIEVCRHLRRVGWQQPIVLMSARATSTDRARARVAGAELFLAKPFPLSDLTEAVSGLIELASDCGGRSA